MPKIIIPVNNSAQSGEATLQEVKNLAAVAHPNFAAEVIRDPVSGKVVLVNVHLPEGTAQGNLSNAIDAINTNPGVAFVESFPQNPVSDSSFETAAVGSTPVQWGGASVEDLSGGTLLVSNDAGRSATGTKSLKATLNAAVGSKVSWEHQQSTVKGSVVKRVEFGCSVFIPVAASGGEMIVSIGAAPVGNEAALIISDGTPS